MNSNLITQIPAYRLNLTSSKSKREKLNADLFLLGSLVTASHILCTYFITILEFCLKENILGELSLEIEFSGTYVSF